MKTPANVFIVILLTQLCIFLFVMLRPNFIAPPDRTYSVIGENFFYPSIIRQAKDGAWRIIDSQTTRPTPKVFGYVFFILAGKVAALFNTDPLVMYQLLRITGGVAVMCATYWLITLIVPVGAQTFALIFTLALETAPVLTDVFTKPLFTWSAVSPTQEIILKHFSLPHHLWGEAIGLALICLIFLTIKKSSPLKLLLIVALGFLGTNTLPSYFVIIGGCLFVPWIIYSFFTGELKQTIIPIALASVAIGLAGLFVQLEFAKGSPWNTAAAVEKSWWTTDMVLTPFLKGLSLFYPFVLLLLISLPLSWKTWNKHTKQTALLATAWTILPVGLIYVSAIPWFPIANGRIATDVSNVPIGILSALGMWSCIRFIRSTHIQRLVSAISICVILCASAVLSISYLRNVLTAQEQIIWTVYPTKLTWESVLALNNVPVNSGILVLPAYGEIIPGAANVRTFIGGPHGFLDWIERRALAERFFTGTMDTQTAKEMLRTNDISYVFWSAQEQQLTVTPDLYPDLLDIYRKNTDVTIYKVK